MLRNGFTLSPSLWPYAIHGNNSEIISQLEDNKIIPFISYLDVLKESIKCHHNDIANFIIQNHPLDEKDYATNIFKYYNFDLIKESFINPDYIYEMCKYNYCVFVDFLNKNSKIDFNLIVISKFLFNSICNIMLIEFKIKYINEIFDTYIFI